MTEAHARLHALFDDPAWTWLRKRIRKALELDHPLPTRFVHKNPTGQEIRVASSLMGRSLQSPKSKSLSLPRDEMETLLHSAGLCGSLRELVEILDGPLNPRATLRRQRQEAWTSLRETWPHPPTDPNSFFQGLRRLASRDPETGTALLADLDRLLREIRPDDQLPTRTAARLFGNSHALDRDRPLTRLLALYLNHPPGETRTLWQSFGLTPDEVSSTVLTLGLRFSDAHPVARAANALAEARMPHRILLRHFRQTCTPVATAIYVCENPAIIESAADTDTPVALVCTEGQPSHACLRLLDACTEAGIPLHLRADFDAAGLHIVNLLYRRYPAATFWHFDAQTYRQSPPGPALEGDMPPTPWDPELAPVMSATRHAVHEEQLLPLLLRGRQGGLV